MPFLQRHLTEVAEQELIDTEQNDDDELLDVLGNPTKLLKPHLLSHHKVIHKSVSDSN